jgi:glycosyltransferase involved in cell wall biosynthesis
LDGTTLLETRLQQSVTAPRAAGEPLKIAYSFPFRLGSPGIGAAALSQIQALAERNCSVQVFCWSSPQRIPGAKVFQTQKVFPFPQRFVGRAGAGRLHDRITSTLLKRWSGDFDVVHTWPLAAELTLAVARSRHWLGVREAPNTHTAHAFDVVAKEHRALGIPQAKDNSHTFDPVVMDRETREYDLADLILAPSALAIATFVGHGVARNKLALKSYGFDPGRYRSHAGAHSNKEVTFSFVARCEPRKGLHFALEAWRRSGVADRSSFRVTGRFVPGYRERLLPLLEHKNLSEHDFVDDLRPVYEATDILVLPSVEDGSALVTYEAQASGCALLASDAAGARFTHGTEGLLHRAGDVDTLAQQMRTLVDEPALLLRMQNAAALNAQQYTWARATENLVDAYKAALAAGSAR